MGTVCSSALLGGLVDLDVLDNQGTSVKALGIGVGLGVLEKVQEVLGGLDGPSGAGDAELLACSEMPVSHLFVHVRCLDPKTGVRELCVTARKDRMVVQNAKGLFFRRAILIHAHTQSTQTIVPRIFRYSISIEGWFQSVP